MPTSDEIPPDEVPAEVRHPIQAGVRIFLGVLMIILLLGLGAATIRWLSTPTSPAAPSSLEQRYG